jgi:c-di-GMP-binding flagellar brake protein YcgR
VGDHVECYATRLEGLQGDMLAVLVPMVRLQSRRLAAGSAVRAEYLFRNRRCRFVTRVLGHSADGLEEFLSLPGSIETVEHRQYFRLQTALRPLSVFRLVVDSQRGQDDNDRLNECTIIDLSEGGACLSSQAIVREGERLGMQFHLPRVGRINTRMRVLRIDDPGSGKRNRRMHCMFTDIRLSDRDLIARYLMARQLEMRRRGQL